MRRNILIAILCVLLCWASINAEEYVGGVNVTNAPADATYIVKSSNGSLSNEQSLGALATGMVKNTTTSSVGTLSIGTAGTDYTSPSSSESFTNKTLDANATGNTLKGYGYIQLANPHMAGSGLTAGMDTTNTNEYYGQVTFSNSTDEATNYVEYRLEVPRDIDTTVNLVAWFKFRLGGADTGDHDYRISMASVADSAAYTGSVANTVSLSYTADGSGADGDVETAGGDTLTGWAAGLTAGQLWVIRVARDGDDGTNDASTTDSYSGCLTIRYGFTQ